MNKPKKRKRSPLPNTAFAKVSWLHLSKMGGTTFARSGVEADALLWLQYARDVAQIDRNDLSPDERIRFTLGRMPGANQTLATLEGEHTPDLHVVLFSAATAYIEIGAHEEKFGADNRARLMGAVQCAQAMGVGYGVITQRIRRGHRIGNLQRLQASRRYLSMNEMGRALEDEVRQGAYDLFLSSERGRTVPEVAVHFAGAGPIEFVEHCVWAALAAAEEEGRLTPSSELVRFDLGTRFSILAAAPQGPGPLESLMQTLDAEPIVIRESKSARPMVMPSMDGLPDGLRTETNRRLAIVHDRERCSDSWAVIATRHRTSERVARYYWKLYQQAGDSALIPARRNGRGVKAHSELLAKVADLRRNRDALQVHKHPELRALARRLGTDITVRQVRRHLRVLRVTDPQRKEGARKPIGAYRGDPAWRRDPHRPLEAVQVDAVNLDSRNRADGTGAVLPGAQAIVVLDVATRTVLGLQLCLATPSELDYRRALLKTFLPHDDLVREVQADTPYPCYGLPEVITGDRGWIFTAKHVREDLIGLGVRCEHAAAYQPTMKADIERYLGTLNNFLHGLPGTTLSGLRRRDERVVTREAERVGLTMSELERAIALFNITVYHQSPHRGLNYATPLDVWQERALQFGVPRLPDTDDMRQRLRLFGMIYLGSRKRDPRGYHIFNTWFVPMGEEPEVADLFGDPDDIRTIAVCHRSSDGTRRYSGDAYCLALRDADRPVTTDDLKAMVSRAPQATGGTQDRAEALWAKFASGRSLRPKEAREVEAHSRNQARPRTQSEVSGPLVVPDLRLRPRGLYVISNDPIEVFEKEARDR